MSFLFSSPSYQSSRPSDSKSASSVSSVSASSDVPFSFECEYYDPQAALLRRYQLTYFSSDETIELFDLKNRKLFLKRCAYPAIQLKDLFLGAQVTIYARQLKLVAYGDKHTESKLSVEKERGLALIRPSGYESAGRILSRLTAAGLKIARAKLIVLSEEEAQGVQEKEANLSRGPSILLELVGQSASSTVSSLGLPELSAVSASSLDYFSSIFQQSRTTATFSDCTVALIKPHSINSGDFGPIVQAILDAGWEISALESFNLDRQAAEEYLEIYRTVVPEYHALVEQLTAGTSVALEIRGSEADAQNLVNLFREFAGPSDPEIAKQIRPESLRAKFGLNKVKNAIHVTDLEEDGVLESQFFFEILQTAAARK